MSNITNFIKEYMGEIFQNFKQKEWCSINKFHLSPNFYSNILHQEYYLLKYFPAYFTEYFHALDKFFESFNKTNLKILSIGCGAGIDYYALKYYIENKNMTIDIYYKCIDIIDWHYKPKETNFSFVHSDINDMESNIFNNIDLVIFPKILTELNNATLDNISEKLKNATLKNELYFINSYITDNSHNNQKIDGVKQFEKICNTLKGMGYSISGDSECTAYMYLEKHEGIRAIYNFFIYPQEILDILKELKSNCEHAQDSIECAECSIGTFPVLNTKYIAYNVIKFEK